MVTTESIRMLLIFGLLAPMGLLLVIPYTSEIQETKARIVIPKPKELKFE